jgi:SAM-dependent methyltransferase
MAVEFDPKTYWSQRLADVSGLRGVGHLEYDARYNRWLYRQKRRVLDEALSDVPAGATALDIGSGVGWVVGYLQARGLSVAGCDISEEAVAALSRAHPTGDFFSLAIGSAPIPRADAAYDVITMMDVAYHIVDDARWRAAIGELARVVRRHGQIIVTDAFGETSHSVADHVRFRSARDWEDAAAEAGLRITRVGPLFRWIARPRNLRGWRRLPDDVRGGIEFALESAAPVSPHMRWAVLSTVT